MPIIVNLPYLVDMRALSSRSDPPERLHRAAKFAPVLEQVVKYSFKNMIKLVKMDWEKQKSY